MDHLEERAISLAAVSHMGQMYGPDEPYIFHPLRVMLAAPPIPKIRAVAVMHDCIEDTKVTAELLHERGWSEEIIAAVLALSRVEGETYNGDFIPRCRANPIARIVKPLDLKDNLSRIHRLDPERRAKLEPRYRRALEQLA